jgi:signal transduction histidine kinase
MALRIAALYLISVLLLLLGLGAALFFSVENTLLETRRQDLRAYAADDAAFLQRAISREDDLVALAPVIATTLPHAGGGERTVRVFSANGTLLAALPPDPAGTRIRPSPATVALLPPSLLSLTRPVEDNPGLIYAAQPIAGTGSTGQPDTIGVVEVSQSRADIDAILSRLRGAFAFAAALAAVLAAGAGLLLSRSIARPVRRLEGVATAIAGGDLSRRVTGLPRNEVGALGESFNRMATRLAALLAEARGEQARLAALLASLTDGVLACDAAGTLTLENPAAREMLGVPRDAPPDTMRETAAQAGLGDLWRKAMGQAPGRAHAGPVEAEIQAAGHVLLAVATPIGDQGGGAVCVLRDITRLRELERGRTAILRRLGHELRTPLTALRTVLANLSDTAPPEHAAALAAAEAEAARLGRLVEEMLAISRGRTAATLDQRPIDLGTLGATTCALFAGRAARLGVALQGPDPAAAAVVARGDPDRLRQVLVNLLDNALRHTPPGGHIAVGVQAHDGPAVLTVRDDGEGMDAQTSRWAFEPYYQGSEAAGGAPARATGSSGLGLAIVREIVSAHGGTIALDSAPGAGTTVTVRLPLAGPVTVSPAAS